MKHYRIFLQFFGAGIVSGGFCTAVLLYERETMKGSIGPLMPGVVFPIAILIALYGTTIKITPTKYFLWLIIACALYLLSLSLFDNFNENPYMAGAAGALLLASAFHFIIQKINPIAILLITIAGGLSCMFFTDYAVLEWQLSFATILGYFINQHTTKPTE